MRKKTTYLLTMICFLLFIAGVSVNTALAYEPAIGFAFNGELAVTDSEFEFCYNEEVTVTLDEIWEGVAPFTITWQYDGPSGIVSGTGTYSLGGEFFSDILDMGTYTVTLLSVEDADGYTVTSTLSYYRAYVTIHPEPEVTDATMIASLDGDTWAIPVGGNLATGFELCLDPLVDYFYLNIYEITVSTGLLTNTFEQNEFFLGLDGPVFYLSFDGTDYQLIDGYQYLTPPNEVKPLRVNGDFPPGTYTYTGTVTDVNGCVSEPIDVVITFKHMPVLAACPTELNTVAKNGSPSLGDYDFERYNDPGVCGAEVPEAFSAEVLFGTPTPTVTYSVAEIGPITETYLFPVGETEVLVTAENECGTDTCVFTVYVEDNEPPQLKSSTFTCENLDMDMGNLCFSEALVFDPETLIDDVTALYEDNCGVFTVTYAGTEEVASSDCNWVLEYLYRIEDQYSNAVTCTVTYSGGDTEGPVVVNADELDMTFDCKGQIPAPNPDILVLDDNCSNSFTVTWAPDIIINGDCLHNYTLLRVYTIKDACGNPTIFTQTFTVDDQIAPVLIGDLPPGGDLGNVCEPPAPMTGEEMAELYTDNCSGAVTATLIDDDYFGDVCAWVVTYTYNVSDICGNTVTPVIVYSGGDTEAPGLISETLTAATLDQENLNLCLDAAVAFDPWVIAPDVLALYEDNCTETPTVTAVVTTPGDNNTDCVWTFAYELRIEDSCGNAVTPTVTYSGGDTEAPTGTNTATLAEVDACFENALGAAPFSAEVAIMGYTDNCGSVTATYNDQYQLTGNDCSWTITYTFSVWDECENELPDQTYAVSGRNLEPPSLTGYPYAGEHDVNACKYAALDEAPFDAALAVTGYEAYCPGGTVTAVYTAYELTGDDCAWVITYTFSVVDGCGLGLESQTYTNSGGNMEPPFIVEDCPIDQDVLVDEGKCTFTVPDNSWDAVFVDYCSVGILNGFNPTKIGPIGNLTATYTLSGATEGSGTISLVSVTFNVGVTEVVWSAVDDCGNPASCTFAVTVRPRSLSGIVSYYKYDAQDLPIEGVLVKLMKDATPDKGIPGIITYTYTDDEGYYSFNDPDDLKDADWIEVSTDIPHGGLSSGDALAVSLRVATTPPTYWAPAKFLDHVGDVYIGTTHPALNTTDAFVLFQRHVGSRSEFDVGDWAFYAPADETIFENTSSNTAVRAYDMDFCEMDISVRTYGDVRGTYNPVGSAPIKSLSPVQSDKVMNVIEGETFELPVTIDYQIAFNAVSFYLDYASDKLEVLEVQSNMPGMTAMIEHGTVRVEWYDLASQSLTAGDAFITLVARTTTGVTPADLLFNLGSATEFVDATAQTIPEVEVSVSSLNTTDAITGITDPDQLGASLEAFPNPFRDELTLNYQIDEPGSVRMTLVSMTGATIAELVNHQHDSGRHAYQLNPGSLALDYGVYFVRMQVQGVDRMYHTHVKLIYMK